jgi:hypothetical protein
MKQSSAKMRLNSKAKRMKPKAQHAVSNDDSNAKKSDNLQELCKILGQKDLTNCSETIAFKLSSIDLLSDLIKVSKSESHDSILCNAIGKNDIKECAEYIKQFANISNDISELTKKLKLLLHNDQTNFEKIEKIESLVIENFNLLFQNDQTNSLNIDYLISALSGEI